MILINDQKAQQTEETEYLRNGIALEKGVALTTQRIEEHRELYEKYSAFFTIYPDIFIDMITPVDSGFKLYFYQRIFLRACMRYKRHYVTAPRAFSKTFICIFALFLKAIFLPNSKGFICAPGKEQSSQIFNNTLDDILDKVPLLRKEIVSRVQGKDYSRIILRNGSKLDVVGARDSQRGGRRHYGLLDELRDHDGDVVNEIVIPLVNVARRMRNGKLNPYEPHSAQFFMTSAAGKNSYAYQKLIEVFEQSIFAPKFAFCWGCDYEVPMKYGLLDPGQLRDIRSSTTFKDESFLREYCARWIGGGKGSWITYEKLLKYRKIINPTWSENSGNNKDFFYLLAVDVGRFSCQTVVTVFQVREKNEHYHSKVVNVIVLGRDERTKNFNIQAADLKRIIAKINPAEVVIDANGLGCGFMDFMVLPSYSEKGEKFPAYCAINGDQYTSRLYPDAIPLCYCIKDNATLTSQINNNLYNRLNRGYVTFLAPEKEIKIRLMEREKKNFLSLETKIKRIMPHEMTTKLLEEICNFKFKQSANPSDFKLEKINTGMLSDKESSFKYGLWRINELEEEHFKQKRKRAKRR